MAADGEGKGARGPAKAGVALALLALALYLPAIGWGAPYATAQNRTHAWGVDDETPIGALGQVANLLRPSEERNAGYPKGHPILVTAAYLPYLGALWLGGGIEQASSEYPFGLKHPVRAIQRLAVIGYVLSALLAALAIAAGFHAAALVWDERSALCGGLLAAVAFPMFYYARTGNVDVPVLAFIALSAAALARCVVLGATAQRAAWLGAFVGAALAIKESAAGVALGTGVALVVACARQRAQARVLAASLAGALVVYALASGALLDTRWWLRHLAELAGKAEHLATGESPVARVFAMTPEGHWGLGRASFAYLSDALSAPGLALGLTGVAYALLAEPRRAWLAWPAFGYLAVVFLTLRSAQLRYMLPFAFFLALFAGRLVARALASRSPALRAAAGALFAAAIGLGLARGVALTWDMHHDSRYAAGAWLAERTQPGDRIEFFGASQTLPPIEPGVITAPATEFSGMFVVPRLDDAKANEIRAGWRERNPRFVLVIPDHTSTGALEHSLVLPPQLFASLVAGREEWRLVAEFHTAPLLPWLPLPALDYPTVNPPIRVFARREGT